MTRTDIKAVLLETPGLSDVVRNLLSDPGKEVTWTTQRINELLQEYGWAFTVDKPLVRELYNDLYPAEVVLKQDWLHLNVEDQYLETSPKSAISYLAKEAPVSIKNVTYVNGMDVANMSVEDFLRVLKETDAEIKRLDDMGLHSDVIDKKISSLKEDRETVIKLLDDQHSDDD